MLPVDQLSTDFFTGDCFRCCVASLLEMPAADVPNFVEAGQDDAVAAANDWLRRHNRRLVSFYIESDDALKKVWFEDPTECVISGPSPRAVDPDHWHAVVGIAHEWGVRVVHDPHPSREGLAPGARWVRLLLAAG